MARSMSIILHSGSKLQLDKMLAFFKTYFFYKETELLITDENAIEDEDIREEYKNFVENQIIEEFDSIAFRPNEPYDYAESHETFELSFKLAQMFTDFAFDVGSEFSETYQGIDVNESCQYEDGLLSYTCYFEDPNGPKRYEDMFRLYNGKRWSVFSSTTEVEFNYVKDEDENEDYGWGIDQKVSSISITELISKDNLEKFDELYDSISVGDELEVTYVDIRGQIELTHKKTGIKYITGDTAISNLDFSRFDYVREPEYFFFYNATVSRKFTVPDEGGYITVEIEVKPGYRDDEETNPDMPGYLYYDEISTSDNIYDSVNILPKFFEEDPEYLNNHPERAIEKDSSSSDRGSQGNMELELELSGTQYEGRIKVHETMQVGDEVLLVREPDNEYDSDAINVTTLDGRSLGRIPAGYSTMLSRRIDRGYSIFSYVSYSEPLSKRSKRARKPLMNIKVIIAPKGTEIEKPEFVTKVAKDTTGRSDEVNDLVIEAKANKSEKVNTIEIDNTFTIDLPEDMVYSVDPDEIKGLKDRLLSRYREKKNDYFNKNHNPDNTFGFKDPFKAPRCITINSPSKLANKLDLTDKDTVEQTVNNIARSLFLIPNTNFTGAYVVSTDKLIVKALINNGMEQHKFIILAPEKRYDGQIFINDADETERSKAVIELLSGIKFVNVKDEGDVKESIEVNAQEKNIADSDKKEFDETNIKSKDTNKNVVIINNEIRIVVPDYMEYTTDKKLLHPDTDDVFVRIKKEENRVYKEIYEAKMPFGLDNPEEAPRCIRLTGCNPYLIPITKFEPDEINNALRPMEILYPEEMFIHTNILLSKNIFIRLYEAPSNILNMFYVCTSKGIYIGSITINDIYVESDERRKTVLDIIRGITHVLDEGSKQINEETSGSKMSSEALSSSESANENLAIIENDITINVPKDMKFTTDSKKIKNDRHKVRFVRFKNKKNSYYNNIHDTVPKYGFDNPMDAPRSIIIRYMMDIPIKLDSLDYNAVKVVLDNASATIFDPQLFKYNDVIINKDFVVRSLETTDHPQNMFIVMTVNKLYIGFIMINDCEGNERKKAVKDIFNRIGVYKTANNDNKHEDGKATISTGNPSSLKSTREESVDVDTNTPVEKFIFNKNATIVVDNVIIAVPDNMSVTQYNDTLAAACENGKNYTSSVLKFFVGASAEISSAEIDIVHMAKTEIKDRLKTLHTDMGKGMKYDVKGVKHYVPVSNTDIVVSYAIFSEKTEYPKCHFFILTSEKIYSGIWGFAKVEDIEALNKNISAWCKKITLKGSKPKSRSGLKYTIENDTLTFDESVQNISKTSLNKITEPFSRVILPKNLKRIDSTSSTAAVFPNARQIKEIIIESDGFVIEENLLNGTVNLEKVIINGNNVVIANMPGAYNRTNSFTVVINGKNAVIGPNGFFFSKLKEITVNNGLKTLGISGFYHCEQLERIEINGVVEEFAGDSAFDHCENLKEFVVDGVKFTGETAREKGIERIMKSAARDMVFSNGQVLYAINPSSNITIISHAPQSQPNLQTRPAKKEGCYIATAVYGSYEAPQVLVLRQFRDEVLKKSFIGRLFIKCYYTVSPTVVKIFKGNKLFNSFWRKVLDKFVEILTR